MTIARSVEDRPLEPLVFVGIPAARQSSYVSVSLKQHDRDSQPQTHDGVDEGLELTSGPRLLDALTETPTEIARLVGLVAADLEGEGTGSEDVLVSALRDTLTLTGLGPEGVLEAERTTVVATLPSSPGSELAAGDVITDTSAVAVPGSSGGVSVDNGDVDMDLDVDRLDVRVTPIDLETDVDVDSDSDGVTDGIGASDRDADTEREDVLEIDGDAEDDREGDGVGPGRSSRSCASKRMNFTLEPALCSCNSGGKQSTTQRDKPWFGIVIPWILLQHK
jgi:hypothetical protein